MRHQKWDKVNFNAGEGQPKTGFVPFQGEGGRGGTPLDAECPLLLSGGCGNEYLEKFMAIRSDVGPNGEATTTG